MKLRDFKEEVKGIYILSNSVNDKVYIGKSNNIANRVKSHLTCSNSKGDSLYIEKAIKEIGEEKFNIEVLEIIKKDSRVTLNQRKTYWINKYKSDLVGYNVIKDIDVNTYRINFGKHNGKLFKDIPQDYWNWLGTIDLNKNFQKQIDNYFFIKKLPNPTKKNK